MGDFSAGGHCHFPYKHIEGTLCPVWPPARDPLTADFLYLILAKVTEGSAGSTHRGHFVMSWLAFIEGLPGGSVVKNPPANAGDSGLIPDLEELLEEETHSIIVWKIPWTEEPGGLQSLGSQRVRYA